MIHSQEKLQVFVCTPERNFTALRQNELNFFFFFFCPNTIHKEHAATGYARSLGFVKMYFTKKVNHSMVFQML